MQRDGQETATVTDSYLQSLGQTLRQTREGRGLSLEQAEFERRIELAEHARTIEELDELIADFPAGVVAGRSLPAASPGAPSCSAAHAQRAR